MTNVIERSEWLPSFKREPLPLPPGNLFRRKQAATVISQLTRQPIAQVAEDRWPSDRLINRAAVAPAMTGTTGWAAELATRTVVDSLETLGPVSAAAQIMGRGLVINFDGYGSASAPGFTASAANAGFVGEGDPIPVRQLVAAGTILQPHKLAAIAVLTREMVESSNAEALIGDALARSEGLALDAAFFDAAAGTAIRPAGIRNGIAAVSPSNNADPFAAFFEDVGAIVNAVGSIGGKVVLVAGVGRAMSMALRYAAAENITIIGSPAVGNDLIAIAPAALIAALSPDPEIETSNAATLHMSDTPSAIVNGGAPASPARSLFQTDSIAVKVRWPVSWALRSTAAVAWVTPSWK